MAAVGKDYHEEDHAISEEVDPKSILRCNVGNHLVYTEDNKVLYFRGILEKEKKR